MDAAALYALVDVLAPMEVDMRTGHSSFAKVNERHAALRAIAEAAADATNVPLRPALPGWHPFSTERSNQPSTAAPAAPAVSALRLQQSSAFHPAGESGRGAVSSESGSRLDGFI